MTHTSPTLTLSGHLNMYERIPSRFLASVQLFLARLSRKLSYVPQRSWRDPDVIRQALTLLGADHMQARRFIRGGLVSPGPGKDSSNSMEERNAFQENVGTYETKIKQHEAKIEERTIENAFHTMIGMEMLRFGANSYHLCKREHHKCDTSMPMPAVATNGHHCLSFELLGHLSYEYLSSLLQVPSMAAS